MSITNTGWNGASAWAKLHRWALAFRGATEEGRQWIARFTDSDLPCGACKESFRAEVAANPFDAGSAFAWSVDRHNAVNAALGKPALTVDAARELWSKPVPLPVVKPAPKPVANVRRRLVPAVVKTDRAPVSKTEWDRLSTRIQNRTEYWIEEAVPAKPAAPTKTTGFILRHKLSPGDVCVMTAAVRDLYLAHGRSIKIAVDTSCGDLWDNNPYLSKLDPSDPGVRAIDCHYPSIGESNQAGRHFVEGFVRDAGKAIGLPIPLTDLKGDIHLSDAEKQWPDDLVPDAQPFWIIMAGGKYDFTAKWYGRYQEIVDRLSGHVRFVQCGEAGHWHEPLKGVVNLVGKTSPRQFLQLIYHSSGVLCPVTFAMHAAAAVPIKPGSASPRPCVVLSGGREPPAWERYPGHKFFETIGKLPCCATSGCWKSRCQKVGDGDAKDSGDLCERPVRVRAGLEVPECMDIISPAAVADAVLEFQAKKPRPRTMYIAYSGTIGHGHCLGDSITEVVAATMMVENDPHERILLSLDPRHALNFAWDVFCKRFLVEVLWEEFPNNQSRYAAFDRRRRTRQVQGIQFDTYKEIYKRLDGGSRQNALAGGEVGLGRRNIFDYYYFGQESAAPVKTTPAIPPLFDVAPIDRAAPMSVFVAIEEKTEGNRLFTFEFWREVIDRLLVSGVSVTLNVARSLWPDLDHPLLTRTYQHDGNLKSLYARIAGQRMVLCGNTGVGWFALAAGVPLIAMESPSLQFLDYRYQWSGAPSLVRLFSFPDAAAVASATVRWINGSRPKIRTGDFRAQHNEDRWMNDHWEELSLPEVGTFVDVGAGRGDEISNSYWLEQNGWSGLVIDPDPRNSESLQKRRATYVRCAVAETSGALPFTMAYKSDLSGFLRTEGEQIEVQTEPLNSLLDAHGIHNVDVLSIDTEGTELEVWRTLDLSRFRPKLVLIEWNTEGLRSRKAEIVAAMQECGYRHRETLGANLLFVPTASTP